LYPFQRPTIVERPRATHREEFIMSQEPEYLRKLREARKRRKEPAGGAERPEHRLTPQEQETLKWARETAGTDLRAVRELAGARYAALLRVQSATGTTYHSVQGLPDRAALLQRLMPDAGMGEEVVAAYEVRGGRPIRIEVEEGEVKLRMGKPRPGAHPVDPEKMLRQAAVKAAQQAKNRFRGGKDRTR
jgi:hypothetical protein